MIDPDKLPSRALLDSGVFIRAQGERPRDPLSPACREFWAEMLKSKRQMLIAAPTVTEVTRHTTKYKPVPIPSVDGFFVVDFDQLSAIWLAKNLPEQVIHNEARPGIFIDYLRYDALILACAARHNAVFITLEGPLHGLADKAGVPCKTVTDFEKETPRQTAIEWTGPAAPAIVPEPRSDPIKEVTIGAACPSTSGDD